MKNILKYLALVGNVLYILWILYNAIDEGPQDVGPVQATALTGLIILLVINIIVLTRKTENSPVDSASSQWKHR